ncbi:MAG: extracellular metalloproteinase, partial [Candidatus Hydrogenedentota bacterium]
FLVLAILSATPSAWAIQPGDDLPTYDSRLEVPALTQAAVESVSAEEIEAQNNAADLLRSGDVNFRVSYDELFGTPTFVRSTSRFLTDADPQGNRMVAIREFVRDNSGLFILNDSVLDGTRVSSDYTSANNGVRHIYLQQTINGLDLIGAGLSANFTRDGQLINISSTLLPVPDSLTSNPGITAAEAARNAAANVGITLTAALVEQASANRNRVSFARTLDFDDAPAAGLAYFPMARNDIRLVWQVEVPEVGAGNVYQTAVDAASAAVLYRTNLTNYFSSETGDSISSVSTEDASYLVYELDSPAPDQGTMTRSLQTLKYLDVTASPDGWINDGDNTAVGNNVEAYTDIDADNLPDAGQPTTGVPYRIFSFAMNLANAPSTYDDASTTQLFYMNNLIHDRLYQVGFDEASGNFQLNNFGKGGLGNDHVRAEGQDGSGTNNANFLTLVEGTRPRMQMYLGTGWVPSHDGVFDTHVVMHEYGHGWSKRLVGGPGNVTVLNNIQQGGEGWSDFLGMLLLAKPGDEVPAAFAAPFPVGTYLINNPGGIRPFPYSTDFGVNPHTYSDISAQVVPHGVGAVWCEILWVTTSKMALVHGFSAFDEMLQLTSDGLKLTPVSPTFLDARDAILQADLVNNGGANACTLWTGFAERGLGFSATTPGPASKSGTDAFDVSPLACASSAGVVLMDLPGYSCGNTINVQLVDLDLTGIGIYPVVLSSTTGDVETLTLVENPPASGLFEGSIVVVEGAVTAEDGTLDATDGDVLTATYNDADDGSGSPAVSTDTAGFICLPAGAQTLTTTFAGGNGFAGNTFDAEVNQIVQITSFDVHLDNPASVNQIDIYYRLDSSVGNENNAAGWILLGSDPNVVSAGIGSP